MLNIRLVMISEVGDEQRNIQQNNNGGVDGNICGTSPLGPKCLAALWVGAAEKYLKGFIINPLTNITSTSKTSASGSKKKRRQYNN